MNKAVLFDLDGVLVDACDWHYEALNRALKDVANYEIPREEHVDTYNGLPTLVKLKLLSGKGIIKESEFQKVSNLKQELTINVIDELCNIDYDKISLMARLKDEGYKLGCVTNSIEKTAILMLKRSGVLRFMDCVVSNQDVANAKPHPEGYISAMVMLNSLPKDTIIVEDSDKGLQAARSTGSTVIQVKNAAEVTRDLI
jgi:beta-phosphoglucomutase|tara:strand:+ start:12 stop:608 length:597 start_codon:yes stop_codon:yes gene_type:complete